MDRIAQVSGHLKAPAPIAPGASSADVVPPLVRAFLRHEFDAVDPRLEKFMKELANRGGGECWHKRGTFIEHLFQTYRSLVIWEGAPTPVTVCGLMHSAYSNSYVNLAIFPPDVSRPIVKDLVGAETEELINLFCTINRQKIVIDGLLNKFPEHTLRSPEIQEIVPKEGVVAKHIRTGADILIPRKTIAQFVLLTMADYQDQFYAWQDLMMGKSAGLGNSGGEEPEALWPGDCRPGLYLNLMCRFAHVLRHLIALEVRDTGVAPCKQPPLFNYGTEWLDNAAQLKSRELYFDVITTKTTKAHQQQALQMLHEAVSLNPHVGEFHILLAQIYISRSEWSKAEEHAVRGVKLLCEWTTVWDKRMSWEGWIAWGRVMVQESRNKRWPKTAFGVIGLGLVQ